MRVTADRRWLRYAAIGVGVAALCPWRAGWDNPVAIGQMLRAPSGDHPLGTDNLGRDLWTLFHQAIADTTLPLWGAISAAAALGILLGTALATSHGRWWAAACHHLIAAITALPAILWVFAACALAERSSFTHVLTCLSVLAAIQTAGAIHLWSLRDGNLGYWQAHAAAGGPRWRRLVAYGLAGRWRRDLAGLWGQLLQSALVTEVALAYLSFGVQPPGVSLGNLLSQHYSYFLRGGYPHLLAIPAFLALALLLPQLLQPEGRDRESDPPHEKAQAANGGNHPQPALAGRH